MFYDMGTLPEGRMDNAQRTDTGICLLYLEQLRFHIPVEMKLVSTTKVTSLKA
jgi:hypothetical protein